MYCRECGFELSKDAQTCVGCGAPVEQAPVVQREKNNVTAGMLALFFGAFGVHNFYLGNRSKAMTQLLVSTIGGILSCGISTIAMGGWAFIEAIQHFRRAVPGDNA